MLVAAFVLGGFGAPPVVATHEGPALDPTAHPVVIGIPDTGINPYHHMYYREGLTAHPSTYIDGFPADIPALPLSVGGTSWDAMFDADIQIWEGIEEDKWYWIPETVFVAVYCDSGQRASHRGTYCILDDGHMHGTGTTSSALMENPNALFAFAAGGSSIAPFASGGIPVDVFSVSWGTAVPIPGHPSVACVGRASAPIYVTSAGNDPRSTLIDCWKGDPQVISVGGAYAANDGEETFAAKQPDVVSYYCRPVAQTMSVFALRSSYCGTSFSGPTVAGALSKVIQAVRTASGYNGGIQGHYVDPVAGFTIHDLRAAMNRTASYDPEAQYPNSGGMGVNDDAPWLQWSWGFYDGLVADATIAHVLGDEAPEKPLGATVYMTGVHAARTALYGTTAPLWPFVQDDAGSGRDAPSVAAPDLVVLPDQAYGGTLMGLNDAEDYYAFWGEAGDEVVAKARGGFTRFAVLDGNGFVIDSAIATAAASGAEPATIGVTLDSTGMHYVHVYALHLTQYGFSFGLDGDAPEPGFAGTPVPPPPVV